MTDLHTSRTLTLESKYTEVEGDIYLGGVQALVRVIFDQLRRDRAAGLNTAAFASGYPGSPLGGFDRELQQPRGLREALNVVHRPGHNEELAATSVAGSQLVTTFPDPKVDGVLGVWYGKAPGLDRSLDAIRHGQFIGTSQHGGVLAFVGDDPATKSSTIPSASELTLKALDLPILEPASVQDILDLGAHGATLSRASGLWTAFRLTAAVADAVGSVDGAGPNLIAPIVPTIDYQGAPYQPEPNPEITGRLTILTEREILEARTEIARAYGAVNSLDKVVVNPSDAWLGIVSRGTVFNTVVNALERLGLSIDDLHRYGIRLLQMRMINPVDREVIKRFADGLEHVVVIEEKRAFVETAIRDVLYNLACRPAVVGRLDLNGRPLIPTSATLSEADLVEPLRGLLSIRIPDDQLRPRQPERRHIPVAEQARTAYFCSGCPHSSSTRVPEGSLVGGGIGCHAMASWMDEERFGNFVVKCQMGGEGATWIGIEPFVETDHLFQNVGDGTYFHSAQLAVQAAVAAGSHITFKILYNGTIAMTGGQSPASSNARSVPELAQILLQQGIGRVIVTTEELKRYKGVAMPKGVDVWDRSRLIEAQEILRGLPGVTALIHDQQCAAEKRRGIKRGLIAKPEVRVIINERVCEGCGDCGSKSNCLSVEPVDTSMGRKTRINQTSCNTDYSCLDGDCPAFVTVVPGKVQDAAIPPAPALSELPDPPAIAEHQIAFRMPGIGGTGVVTASQLLGTAALIDGRHVTGFDQTGLSQKAGPVVSDLAIGGESDGTPSGTVDSLIAFDMLVAAAPANLDGLVQGTSRALISTSATPTGEMVSHVESRQLDVDRLREILEAAVGPNRVLWIDATSVCTALLGDTTASNTLMLGIAVQSGMVPVTPAAVEQAIELNGVAVVANTAAFRWGRLWATDRERVEAAASAVPNRPTQVDLIEDAALPASISGELRYLVANRASDLIKYQNRKYANRYLDVINEVADRETECIGEPAAFTETTARYLYKLMAYKDEYEVARLLLDDSEQQRIKTEFGSAAKVTWNLHPPVLRSVGVKKKMRFGAWSRPAMSLLVRGRRLRGTRLDPFGRASVRRIERALIVEYRAAVLAAAESLSAERVEASVQLAALPDLVRGYEGVKLANVEKYRIALLAARAELNL